MTDLEGPTPSPEEGQQRAGDREERGRMGHAVARANEDRARADAMPLGPERDRMEHAAATHERAVQVHEEAARLRRVHHEHEAEGAEHHARGSRATEG